MYLSEILNLYKLSADPQQLDKFKDVFPKGKHPVEDQPINIRVGPGTVITFPYFKINPQAPAPSELAQKLGSVTKVASWEGPPEKFAWNKFPVQKKHYATLSQILSRSNLKFDYMWFITVMGQNSWEKGFHPIHWFIAISGKPDNPSFVWYKYGGYSPMAGQNRVYTAPQTKSSKMQTSEFLTKTPQWQDSAISLKPDQVHAWRISYKWFDVKNDRYKSFNFKVNAKTASEAKRIIKKRIRENPKKYEPNGKPFGWGNFNGYFTDPKRLV